MQHQVLIPADFHHVHEAGKYRRERQRSHSITFLEPGNALADFHYCARDVFTEDSGIVFDDNAQGLHCPIERSQCCRLDLDEELPRAWLGCWHGFDDERCLLLWDDEGLMFGHGSDDAKDLL